MVNTNTLVTNGKLDVNDGGEVDNSGTINVASGGALSVDSTSTLNTLDGSELDVSGLLTINGTMNVTDTLTLDTEGHTVLIADAP